MKGLLKTWSLKGSFWIRRKMQDKRAGNNSQEKREEKVFNHLSHSSSRFPRKEVLPFLKVGA